MTTGIFEQNLNTAKDILIDMTKMVEFAKKREDFNVIWDMFWVESELFPFNVEYCDPDTNSEEDIMARYNALVEFMGDDL